MLFEIGDRVILSGIYVGRRDKHGVIIRAEEGQWYEVRFDNGQEGTTYSGSWLTPEPPLETLAALGKEHSWKKGIT